MTDAHRYQSAEEMYCKKEVQLPPPVGDVYEPKRELQFPAMSELNIRYGSYELAFIRFITFTTQNLRECLNEDLRQSASVNRNGNITSEDYCNSNVTQQYNL